MGTMGRRLSRLARSAEVLHDGGSHHGRSPDVLGGAGHQLPLGRGSSRGLKLVPNSPTYRLCMPTNTEASTPSMGSPFR